MDDGLGRGSGRLRREHARHLVDLRYLACLVDIPELGEAAHLALEVAAGARERRELGPCDVGGVDLDERVDEVEPERACAPPPSRGPAAAPG